MFSFVFRVNGVVRNMPEFAEAFDCPADAKLNPSKRCTLWWTLVAEHCFTLSPFCYCDL